MAEGILGNCGECDYYGECDWEGCSKDKDPHGRCYVQPPEWTVVPDDSPGSEQDDWQVAMRREPPEVYADRPGCRFWRS